MSKVLPAAAVRLRVAKGHIISGGDLGTSQFFPAPTRLTLEMSALYKNTSRRGSLSYLACLSTLCVWLSADAIQFFRI